MPVDKTKTTEPHDLRPVAVTMIGTGTAAAGPAPMITGTIATTPAAHQPNLLITVISPLVAILVRFVHVFLGALSGLLVAAMTPAGGELLYTGDFYTMLVTCANLSVPIAGLGLIKDLVTIFSKLEGRFPLLTGNV